MEKLTRDVSDLDKFKRRLIRTVARLLLQEKRPEEEVWKCLKQETNYECKVLWSRMRALTIKKLDRLFDSNDNVGRIPKAARMSLTDWLLFDMVLVHQNVDVIKMDKLKENPKPLVDLVTLVQKFDIEGKRYESLATAWSIATLYYNNLGHQCSPMLLQLRWYQLKRATRDQFYNFWFAYRGAVKRLSHAEPHTPSPLQVDIARRYKHLVTLTFPEWEEMIEKGEVVLPEMLANKMCEKSEEVKNVPVQEDRTPDLVVIEPEIETIDLGIDSDSEGDAKKSDTEPKSPAEPVKVKEEPVDIDIESPYVEEPRKQHWFDEALQHTAVEHDNLDNDVDSTDDLAVEENELTQAIEYTLKQQKECMLPQITCVFGNVDDSNAIFSQMNALGPTISNPTVNEIETRIENVTQESSTDGPSDGPIELSDDIENPGTPEDIPENIENPVPTIEVPVIENPVATEMPKNIENTVTTEVVYENNDIIVSKNTEKSVDMDIIDLDEDENMDEMVPENKEVKDEIKAEVCSEDAQFAFGELSNDLNFADDGIAFVDDGIAYNDDYETSESKKAEDKVSEETEPKIDVKLLMLPITYTTKLDDMGLKDFQQIQDKQLIDIITRKSKPVMKVATVETPEPQETQEPQEPQDIEDELISDEESVTVPDDQKVNPSSYLLQKPRTRTYHPIQLCKNPDFNTRLKRLTVGFLSSPRNRGLLKACKPLTIDVTKAFENKLKHGTLYLKANETAVLSKDTEVVDRQSVSVIPSAMPAQSLIDNTKPLEIFPSVSTYYEPLKPDNSNERKKVINLPDISEIRRINQTLLTAEVSPIQVQNNTPHVQVSIVSQPKPKPAMLEQVLTSDTSNYPPAVVDITKTDNRFRNVKPLQLKEKMIVERYQDLLTFRPPRSGPKPPSYKVKQFAPRIPWLSKASVEHNIASCANKKDEALITLDTLNKMLFLFVNESGNAEGSAPKKPKVKKKKKAATSKPDSPATVIETDSSANKTMAPKFNIKPGINDPREKVLPEKTSEELADEQHIRNCCCWAQGKLLHMMKIIKNPPLHGCNYPVCTCCCKNILEEYSVNDQLQKMAEFKRLHNIPTDEVVHKDGSRSKKRKNKPTATKNTIEILDDTPAPKEDTRKKVKFIICYPKETVAFPKQNQACQTNADEVVEETSEVTVVKDSPIKSTDTGDTQTTESDGKTDTVIDLEGSNDESPTNVDDDEPVITEVTTAKTSKTSAPADDLSVVTKVSRNANTINKTVVLVNAGPSKKTKPRRKGKVQVSTPSGNPLFVENNKIMLTNVKFPPNLYLFEEAKQVLKTSTKLPRGVSLLLIPDGTVTYAVNPNVEVRATDMAGVPAVVASVQKYINTTSDSAQPVAKLSIQIDGQVVNLTTDKDNTRESSSTITLVPDAEGQTVNEMTSDVSQAEISKESNDCSQDVAEMSADIENDRQTNNEKTSQGNMSETPITIEVPSIETEANTGAATKRDTGNGTNDDTSQESIDETIAETENQQTINEDDTQQSIPQTVTETAEEHSLASQPSQRGEETTNDTEPDTKSQGSSKNILSDLMEMSGIFDDDVPAPGTAAAAAVAPVPQETEPTGMPPALSPLKSLDIRQLMPSSARGLINDLSPITSLCELKYACINNGLFFKLDFQTRLLVPIKVCMKPHSDLVRTSKLPNRRGRPPGQVKTVIDLTEDEDAQPDNVAAKQIPIRVTSGPSILSSKTSKTTKPVKLIKLLPAPAPLSKITTDEVSDPTSRSLLRKYNRKQCLKQNVLLYDNDGIKLKKNRVLTEPFLNNLNSALSVVMSTTEDDENNVTVNIEYDRPQANDSDSSDEEPLAKKAKRKRINLDSPTIENNTVQDIATAASEQGPDLDRAMDVDGPTDSNGPMDDEDTHEMEPQFEILPTDDDDNENSEENCILGF